MREGLGTLLWQLYHPEIPAFLEELSQTQPMHRLRDVGMDCGCEYTKFPRFVKIGPYSRYDHSLGAALIVWHFTGSREQAAAALFHDAATPVFAHVVDFLNGDHLRQESTEAGTGALLAASPAVSALLEKYGLTVEQVEDYHRYPIADNASPALSADRLEYTLGDLLHYGFAEVEEVAAFYQDLTVGEDEQGRPELAFRTREVAAGFARLALCNSRVYVADEDRFAMETLAGILHLALDRGVLRREELWTTETDVIERLRRDAVCGRVWERFCGYSHVLRSKERPTGERDWIRVDAKKRWIDPLVVGEGRVSGLDADLRQEIEAFLRMDLGGWLKGG